MSSNDSSSSSELKSTIKLNYGNYSHWCTATQSKLMCNALWGLCNGDEIFLITPIKPDPLDLGADVTAQVHYHMAVSSFNAETAQYNLQQQQNQKAIGTIQSLCEDNQLGHFETLKTAKDIHTHFSFFITENKKLSEKSAFTDEFLTQIMLMSLPHEISSWETLITMVLQPVLDDNPLTSTYVIQRCVTHHTLLHCAPKDSVLLAKSSKSKKKSGKPDNWPTCQYCKYKGYTEEDCHCKQQEKGTV